MSAPSPGIRVAAGLFAGALLLAAVDAAAIALTIPLPTGGVGLRIGHHLFDALETVGVGALWAAVVGAFAGLVRLPRWATAGIAVAVTMAVVHLALGDTLWRFSSLALDGRFEGLVYAGLVLLLGALIPAAFALGLILSPRPVLRAVVVFLAVGVMAGDYLLLADDYFATHVVVAWGAAQLGGAALSEPAERAGLALVRGGRGRAALGALALLAFLGVAVPPPNAVRYELFRSPCVIAPWLLAGALWRSPEPRGPVPPPPTSRWFQPAAALSPIPPTSPGPLRKDAVVVLITVDAVRADVIEDPRNDALFPTFARLKREGVYFTRASAPGTQTVLSLSTLFSGRYFSELRWTDHGEGRTRYLYPGDDPSVRFPEILSGHGVGTAAYAGVIFLSNEWGVARGFQEETVPVTSWRHAFARELIDPLLGRLYHAGRGPLFLYTHLMEPHAPYDRGRKDGTPRERYLSEIALADAQIGRVLRLLDARFRDRWALFVSADHGEAFGEHGSQEHGKTLYQELLHVPLLARSPRFHARRIDDPVSLVDLGPTILDIFGQETPPTFLGQSLVPLLTGGSVAFTRPLIAEGRLRRSITMPDGLKVIDDPRRKLVEAYDLSTDPGETRNLFDVDPARVDPALATLRAFFAVHTRRGEPPPYKP